MYPPSSFKKEKSKNIQFIIRNFLLPKINHKLATFNMLEILSNR